MPAKNRHGRLYGLAGAVTAISVCAATMAFAPALSRLSPPQQLSAATTVLARSPGDPQGGQQGQQQTFLQKEEAQGGDCVLTVPADPLTAAGLATPYQLTGPDGQSPAASGCTMANAANLGAFVQATILEPDGQLAVYNPLVVTAGTTPAEPAVVPVIPPGSVVTVASGFNGNILFLQGPGAGFFSQGLPGSPFGQEAWANAPAFYFAAEHRAAVPPLGKSTVDNMPCPTTRDYSIVDQDPNDNVTAHYLLTADGLTAQNNAANAAALGGATVIQNGSDNNLIDTFVDPALGCAPFTAPDLSNGGAPANSQQLDELLADKDQAAPVALVPPNDPMVTVGADDDIVQGQLPVAGNLSVVKTDLYRANVGQPLIFSFSQNTLVQAAKQDCNGLQTTGAARLALDAGLYLNPNVSPGAGMTLAQFLAGRFAASVSTLNCALFNPGSTVTAVPGPSQAAGAPVTAPTDTPTVTPTDTPTVTPTDTPFTDQSAAAAAPAANGQLALARLSEWVKERRRNYAPSTDCGFPVRGGVRDAAGGSAVLRRLCGHGAHRNAPCRDVHTHFNGYRDAHVNGHANGYRHGHAYFNGHRQAHVNRDAYGHAHGHGGKLSPAHQHRNLL